VVGTAGNFNDSESVPKGWGGTVQRGRKVPKHLGKKAIKMCSRRKRGEENNSEEM